MGYIIGGENFDTNGDRLAFDVTQSVRTDFINYEHPTFSILGTGFIRPTQDSIANTGFYGPMFGGAIPEPSTLVLIVLGVATLVSLAKLEKQLSCS